MVRSWGLVALVWLLASCGTPKVLWISSELRDLEPSVRAVVARAFPGGDWLVQTEPAAWPTASTVLRLTTTPNANLPAAAGTRIGIPPDWTEGTDYVPPSALVRLARGADGTWDAVPLFYDVWGQTRFDPIDLSGTFPLAWDTLLSQARPRSVLMAGSRPAFRQWALAAASTAADFHFTSLATWFGQSPTAWTAELASLRQLTGRSLWVPDAWRFTPKDVQLSYRPGTRLVFLETYRDFEGANVPGTRRFFPFQKTMAQGVAVGAVVVFAEVRSADPGAREAILPLLRTLAGSKAQRELGSQTKWLAANLNAPELDGTGSAVRSLVTQARALIAVTDRLPEPLVENNLLVQAQWAAEGAAP